MASVRLPDNGTVGMTGSTADKLDEIPAMLDLRCVGISQSIGSGLRRLQHGHRRNLLQTFRNPAGDGCAGDSDADKQGQKRDSTAFSIHAGHRSSEVGAI